MLEGDNKMSWVITETRNNEEIEVFEVYSWKTACALIDRYSEEDKERLLPCVYKRLGEKSITTEY